MLSTLKMCCPVLSRFDSLSCIRLFVTRWTEARQAPLPMGILQARILEWVSMPSSYKGYHTVFVFVFSKR